MRLIANIAEWFDRRMQLGKSIQETLQHPVPRQTASWFYVFGSAALTAFILQVVTGILLATAGARILWSRLSLCTWCRSSFLVHSSFRES
jgi:ubiquinol-cytochrome c reductase cytochrome b subunit